MDERKKTSFQAGDIVFAKMKSFPPWPAKILDQADYPLTPANKIPVVFYGTNELGYMKKQDVYDFVEYREKFGSAKKAKGFMQGMAEAEADLSGEPLPIETAQQTEKQTPAAVKRNKKQKSNGDEEAEVHPSTKDVKEETISPKTPPPVVSDDEIGYETSIEVKEEPTTVADFSLASPPTTVVETSSSKRVRKPPKSFYDFIQPPPTQSSNRKRRASTSAPAKKVSRLEESHESSSDDRLVIDETPQQQQLTTVENDDDDDLTTVAQMLSKFKKEPVVEQTPTDTEISVVKKNSSKKRKTTPAVEFPPEEIIDETPALEDLPLSQAFGAPQNEIKQEYDGQQVVVSEFVTTTPYSLPEKRVRKKKVFSDDFINPDFLFVTPKSSSSSSASKSKSKNSSSNQTTFEPQPTTTPNESSAKVAPLKIKLTQPTSLSKKSKKPKLEIVNDSSPSVERTTTTDNNNSSSWTTNSLVIDEGLTYFEPPPNFLQDDDQNDTEEESKFINLPSSSTISTAPKPPTIASLKRKLASTKPKKPKPVLKINLLSKKLPKTKPISKSALTLKKSPAASTSPSVKIRREGETETEFRRRRRVENRNAKQSYKLKKLFVTAYSYWSGLEMERLMKDQPDITDFQEIRLLLQSKWRTLSNEEKDRYRILAKQERMKRLAANNSSDQGPVTKPTTKTKTTPITPTTEKKPRGRPRKYPLPTSSIKTESTGDNLSDSSPKSTTTAEVLSPRWIDPDTSAVITRRTTIGPVEARSRWWLFSNTPNAHQPPGRRRVMKKESSPPRELQSELLDAVALFRLMGKSFEQMGNRLIKTNENTNMATGAFVDDLLDGFVVTLVHLLAMTKNVQPFSQCYPKESVSELVDKTAFLTPL